MQLSGTIKYSIKFGNPNTQGIGVGSIAAGATVEIYYNLIVNCASAGFECYGASNGKILFYNNTIYLTITLAAMALFIWPMERIISLKIILS